ncbi:MAG: hypothetical protein PHH13_01555 [Candidatus Peribacteraceae bacterium]|nr:hypothetical protein [Candidatus Peribacteraceae bacterium]
MSEFPKDDTTVLVPGILVPLDSEGKPVGGAPALLEMTKKSVQDAMSEGGEKSDAQGEGTQDTGARRGPAVNKRSFDQGWEAIFGKKN